MSITPQSVTPDESPRVALRDVITPEFQTPFRVPDSSSLEMSLEYHTPPSYSQTPQIMSYEPSFVPPQLGLAYYGTKKRELGKGTYGEVSMYEGLSGKVAIKMMKYNVDDDEGISSTTLREISILLRLNHINVISVLDVFIDPSESQIYLVMPMAKTDLHGFIKKGKHAFMPIKKTAEETDKYVAFQFINGVSYCIDKGIINRDIKPQNVLIYEDGTVKVSDFGLARAAICSVDSGITSVVYTLWYRPLEILLGGKYDDAADVWAVGCTLYELYMGEPLFPGEMKRKWWRG